ncbi:anti-sigma factor [Arenimonas aestuarii]
MKPTDDMLMAYVDGELDPDGVARVEAAMAADPDVAATVAAALALRARLREAFDPVLDEPVPAHLLTIAREGPVSAGATVHALPAPARRRWAWPEWTAMAAALALGIALSQLALRPAAGPFDAGAGGLVAGGALAESLESSLAADPVGNVRVGLSFRSRDGGYCRSFRLEGDRDLSGLACRDGRGNWQVPVLVGSDPGLRGELRQATGALPAAVVSEVEERMSGEPLDAGQERAARDAGWR